MTERRNDRAEIRVAAAPARVWRALTDPALLLRWLPPDGMSGEMRHFDLRPGGGYDMVLRYDDPAVAGKTGEGEDRVAVRIVTVEPPHLLVQEAEFDSPDPAFAGVMRMHWSLTADGAGTRVGIRCENVPPGISRADHEAGLAASLGNLAALFGQA